MRNLIWKIYCLPLWYVSLLLVAAPIAWGLLRHTLNLRGKERIWRRINCVLALLALAGILYQTLLRRDSGPRVVLLQPFISFLRARENREVYRAMLMNVLLFAPLGMTLPETLPRRLSSGRRYLLSVLGCLLLSSGIEALQFAFSLGWVETDDVIMNVLGALWAGLGSLPGKQHTGKDDTI